MFYRRNLLLQRNHRTDYNCTYMVETCRNVGKHNNNCTSCNNPIIRKQLLLQEINPKFLFLFFNIQNFSNKIYYHSSPQKNNLSKFSQILSATSSKEIPLILAISPSVTETLTGSFQVPTTGER